MNSVDQYDGSRPNEHFALYDLVEGKLLISDMYRSPVLNQTA